MEPLDRIPDGIVLYTPAFGPTLPSRGTPPNPRGTPAPGVDLVVRVVEPAGEFRLGPYQYPPHTTSLSPRT